MNLHSSFTLFREHDDWHHDGERDWLRGGGNRACPSLSGINLLEAVRIVRTPGGAVAAVQVLGVRIVQRDGDG